MKATPANLRRAVARGDRYKADAAALRRQLAASRRDIDAVRKASFAAGSAATLSAVHVAVGTAAFVEISQAMAERRKRPTLDPAIAEMIERANGELFDRAGLRGLR